MGSDCDLVALRREFEVLDPIVLILTRHRCSDRADDLEIFEVLNIHNEHSSISVSNCEELTVLSPTECSHVVLKTRFASKHFLVVPDPDALVSAGRGKNLQGWVRGTTPHFWQVFHSAVVSLYNHTQKLVVQVDLNNF